MPHVGGMHDDGGAAASWRVYGSKVDARSRDAYT